MRYRCRWMLSIKKLALVFSLGLCFLCTAYAVAESESNLLLLRVVLGNMILSEGIAGEVRDNEVFVDLSELSEALEESPREGMVSVRDLPDIFPARFEVNLQTQELHIFGRGELGVERRIFAEIEAASQNFVPFVPQRTLIPESDEWFSMPFAQMSHHISRSNSGEYSNSDSLRLYGNLLRGDSSFTASEVDGEFSSAQWTWRRKEWRTRALFYGKDSPHFVAINRGFASEHANLNVGISHHGNNKTAASFNLRASAESGLGAELGADLGKRKFWHAGLNGELFSGRWNLTHSGYLDEVLRSNSRIGIALPHISAYYNFSNYYQQINGHEARVRSTFSLGDNFSGDVSADVLHRHNTEAKSKIGIFHRYNSEGTQYGTGLSYEQNFFYRKDYRINLLWEANGGDSYFSAGASYIGDKDNRKNYYQANFNWRYRLLWDGLMLDTRAYFNRDGLESAFIGFSYILAPNPETHGWSINNKFNRGALSACALNGSGEAAAGGPYRLKSGVIMNKNGCAFVPFAEGVVALDDSKLPPWMHVRQKEVYAKVKAGEVVRVHFNIIGSGEVEGVVLSGKTPLHGMAVSLIPIDAESDLPTGVCVGEMQKGAPPPPESEEEIRKTRVVFDGYYYFGEVAAGEYIIQVDNKWRRVLVTEEEICTADLKLNGNGSHLISE